MRRGVFPRLGRASCAPAVTILAAVLSGACATTENREVVGEAKPVLSAPRTMSDEELEETRAIERAAAESADRAAAASGDAEAMQLDSIAAGAPAGPPAGDTAGGPAKGAAAPDVGAAGRSVSWPSGVDATPDDIANYTIGSVAGRKIPLSDLVAKWIWREPARVRAILDDIVLSRIIIFEAAALQIELPDGAIKKEVETRLARLQKEADAAGKTSLEAYIQEALGMEPETYLRCAQEEAAIDLLAPRCVRAWLLASDHREIRAITVKTTADVDQVQARLARGEAFADVARALSIDPSKEEGGRLPPVVRGGDLALTRTAFATEVGEVAGPIKDRESMLFVYVEAAPPLIEGMWSEVGAEVEASLKARDIEDPEFWQWKAQMLGRYDVNMDPFLDLVK
ncbi:peptidylprolyl isomerase [Planctomycetes bacterium Poly30]|uniref:peptidylprolyl isomerase n=1 Tax=Saltatorellus ferox TaxID=2528018 RepID=A0A518EQW2_9BACT|nr:peptidylprolyl isomerase [Planctomycetes bacterium Poly30]